MEPGQTPAQPGTAPAENPYIKYRTERRTRKVWHSEDGVNYELINDDYDVRVPVPPRDSDLIVLRLVTGATIFMVTAALAWSTAGIGDLLSMSVAAPIAYAAAIGFDAAWMTCMGIEWLNRYRPERARKAMIAGHLCLIVSIAAVSAHGGIKVGSAWVAVIGATVSVIAKAMWMLLLSHTALELDPRARKWMARIEARHGSQLAIASWQRGLHRTQARHAALVAALGVPGQLPDMQSGQADSPIPTTGQTPGAPVLTSADTRPDTVPALSGPVPPVPAPQVPQVAQVPQPLGAPSTPPPPPPPNDEQDENKKQDRADEVVPIERGNLTAALRKLLAAGITDPTTAHRMVVEAGITDAKADTVSRTMRRLQRSA
ncbi:hypothetical protein [Streptomyces xiamenensis]|uniref:hypothetical protein n=1 Tax=Streptomyces xiamenensis TaxID=408015 RepID=UPI0037D5A58B